MPPVDEARSQDTEYGRFITSDGWFVLDLGGALAVRYGGARGRARPVERRLLGAAGAT